MVVDEYAIVSASNLAQDIEVVPAFVTYRYDTNDDTMAIRGSGAAAEAVLVRGYQRTDHVIGKSANLAVENLCNETPLLGTLRSYVCETARENHLPFARSLEAWISPSPQVDVRILKDCSSFFPNGILVFYRISWYTPRQ